MPSACIVGAGIAGLSCAWALAKRGVTVTVIEKHAFATGATIRNFGMVWPIGQPHGPRRQLALRSRDLWLTLARESHMNAEPVGSLHLAYADDEWQVLQEFAAGVGAEIGEALSPTHTLARCPHLRQDGLRGAFFSPHELCVDPRTTAAQFAEFLATQHNVTFHFDESVLTATTGHVQTQRRSLQPDLICICPGHDLSAPFAQLLAEAGAQPVRLQMLRGKHPAAAAPMPHLCASLTFLHYPSFQSCPSYPSFQARMKHDFSEHLLHGIHVMAARHHDQTLTLGDSHHYGRHHSPYSSDHVDSLILQYLDRFLPTERLTITQRWEGTYLKHPQHTHLLLNPAEGVYVFGALGGAGMTLGPALADDFAAEVAQR